MATDSTSRVLRQSHLFLALLILLWGLILCFVGYQYNRERSQIVGLLSAKLQLLDLHMGDNIESGVSPHSFFESNAPRFDNLELYIIKEEDSIVYSSTGDYSSERMLSIVDELRSSKQDVAITSPDKSADLEYIHTIVNQGDYQIYSSSSYSVSLLNVFSRSNTFLLVAVAISILISVIGYITSKLYNHLDITTKERDREHEIARREEQEKIRIKRQLSNNINHELKTPICSILGYLDMIKSNPNLDSESCRKFVVKSYDQAERLRQLMSDLSTITRIDEASSMIEREVLDLTALIEGVMDDVVPQLEKQNIEIRSNIAHQLIIEGNHSLLYSIFRNLTDNAISYSGGRYINIDLISQSDTHYNFSFRDNGIGIDAKHLPYIFERFYRVDKGRSRKVGGTGLGLSIVKNAVLFHSGSIEAKLDEMGGLDFRFSLSKRA